MGTWQEERNCRASIRYAYRNRNDHNSLADHSPLSQILTDRACSAIVAAFTMVGCRNIGGVSVPGITTGGKP